MSIKDIARVDLIEGVVFEGQTLLPKALQVEDDVHALIRRRIKVYPARARTSAAAQEELNRLDVVCCRDVAASRAVVWPGSLLRPGKVLRDPTRVT